MKRPSKSKPSRVDTYKLLNALVLGLFVANVFLIFSFEASRKPKVVHHLDTVVTNRVLIVTNFIDRAASKVDVVPSQINSSLQVDLPYTFSEVADRGIVSILGFNYSVGDRLSYGVITYCGPDRIEFDTGVFARNSYLLHMAQNINDQYDRARFSSGSDSSVIVSASGHNRFNYLGGTTVEHVPRPDGSQITREINK